VPLRQLTKRSSHQMQELQEEVKSHARRSHRVEEHSGSAPAPTPGTCGGSAAEAAVASATTPGANRIGSRWADDAQRLCGYLLRVSIEPSVDPAERVAQNFMTFKQISRLNHDRNGRRISRWTTPPDSATRALGFGKR